MVVGHRRKDEEAAVHEASASGRNTHRVVQIRCGANGDRDYFEADATTNWTLRRAGAAVRQEDKGAPEVMNRE